MDSGSYPLSLMLLSFKTPIEWPPALTETASFPRVSFQLLLFSNKHTGFSAHRAVLITKAGLTFFQHFL